MQEGRAIDNYKNSKSYEESLSLNYKKTNGIYYTPKVIVNYILEEILLNHDIVENPEPKILDLSCGCGNFLLEAYDLLYKLIENNMDKIKNKYGKYYIKDIGEHIASKCIYGTDTDKDAINILKKSLIKKVLKCGNIEKDISKINYNITCEDALKKKYSIKFNYIIGNPPYVGHKILDKNYKKFLLDEYKDVYRDKADLYFCFYKKSLDIIKENGKIGLITPRYFLESPSGELLRYYLFENSIMHKIIDLNGVKVFDNLGISSLILIFSNKNQQYNVIDNDKNINNIIRVYKIKEEKINLKKTYNLGEILNNNICEKISISQGDLRNNWIILNNKDRQLYEKIQVKCEYRLEDIAESFQGVITGCDKSFILHEDDERIKNIDNRLLKTWIKNKNINQYIIEESNQKLIYSNNIEDINDYPYIKENCFLPYKNKLENRRECRNNIRKWYELQWGREISLFERKKIMYPYKSKYNRFAIDNNNSFCSADVYSFFIKEEYKDLFSYEYLLALLNSKVYDKYFKMTAKCMGNKVYDYYPNRVMKIKIFRDNNYEEIEYLCKKIISLKLLIQDGRKCLKFQGKNNILNKEIYYLENESHFLQNKISNLINKSLEL